MELCHCAVAIKDGVVNDCAHGYITFHFTKSFSLSTFCVACVLAFLVE